MPASFFESYFSSSFSLFYTLSTYRESQNDVKGVSSVIWYSCIRRDLYESFILSNQTNESLIPKGFEKFEIKVFDSKYDYESEIEIISELQNQYYETKHIRKIETSLTLMKPIQRSNSNIRLDNFLLWQDKVKILFLNVSFLSKFHEN